jgi:hypothetical protein
MKFLDCLGLWIIWCYCSLAMETSCLRIWLSVQACFDSWQDKHSYGWS